MKNTVFAAAIANQFWPFPLHVYLCAKASFLLFSFEAGARRADLSTCS
jgi:hypothetical protein